MDYEQFKQYMKESVETVTGKEVSIYPLLRNNSLVRDSLSIETAEGEPTGPAPGLWDYYVQYRDGASPGMLVNEVIHACEDEGARLQVNMQILKDFSGLRNRICAKLINREQNRELLLRVPHRAFLDLEIVYYVLFPDVEKGMISMRVENAHLCRWNVTEEALYRASMKNMPDLLPPRVCRMQNLMEELEMTEMYRHMTGKEQRAVRLVQEEQMPLYVMTNRRGLYGASVLLYEGLLERWMQRFPGNVFVIPCSVHEVLLLSAESVWEAQEMNEMIRCVNRTEVAPEEILSDHVYIWDKKTEMLTM